MGEVSGGGEVIQQKKCLICGKYYVYYNSDFDKNSLLDLMTTEMCKDCFEHGYKLINKERYKNDK